MIHIKTMKIQFEFNEIVIEGIKNYRAKAKFEIDGKSYQANSQKLEPITKEYIIKEINERFN